MLHCSSPNLACLHRWGACTSETQPPLSLQISSILFATTLHPHPSVYLHPPPHQAAHVLGTAASNNPTFQQQLLAHHPEAIALLLRLVSSVGTDHVATMALYATGNIARNSAKARRMLYGVGLLPTLQVRVSVHVGVGGRGAVLWA